MARPAAPKRENVRSAIKWDTVGWICALPKEMAAAIAMLDERHDVLPQHPADNNTYVLGTVGRHDVVIACDPAGETGKVATAVVAAHIRFTFERIKISLMVGIAGGMPSDKNDIRLGDIVISEPGVGNGGIVQYDFGKTMAQSVFVHNGSMLKVEKIVNGCVKADLESEKEIGQLFKNDIR